MLKKLNEFYENNKNIKYGCKNEKGNIITQINKSYVKNFNFQSPEELLNSQIGNCWETVELTRKFLEENNIECKTYFFVIPMHKFYCHSIAVCKIENDYYWIENSFKDYKGIRKYNSLKSIITEVLDSFPLICNTNNFNIKNIKIYEYDKPKFHIGCLEFYFHCFKQKNITKKYLPEYLKLIEEKKQ